MILITDAHVSQANGNVEEFYEMLNTLEQGEEDVVFLGDIFDLWISLPRYEDPIQTRFLQWCERVKEKRVVGFVEGNHEFFMVQAHRKCFTWCTENFWQEGDHLFVHGDQINREDVAYLRWRKVSKNLITKTIVRFLPFGPTLVWRLKNKLKNANRKFKISLPVEAIAGYAEELFGKGVRRVLVGHFHQEHRVNAKDGDFLAIIPDWYATGKIGRYIDGKLTCAHWRDLLNAH